jgi:hypothetical protein
MTARSRAAHTSLLLLAVVLGACEGASGGAVAVDAQAGEEAGLDVALDVATATQGGADGGGDDGDTQDGGSGGAPGTTGGVGGDAHGDGASADGDGDGGGGDAVQADMGGGDGGGDGDGGDGGESGDGESGDGSDGDGGGGDGGGNNTGVDADGDASGADSDAGATDAGDGDAANATGAGDATDAVSGIDADADAADSADAAPTGPVPFAMPAAVTDTAALGKPVDPKTLPTAGFVDVTKKYGIDPTATHQACVAVADFDNNGRQDFVVVQPVTMKTLIHTVLLGTTWKGKPSPWPKHVFSKFDVTSMVANFGCVAVDMNADGFPDLLFGGFSGMALYIGDGKGGFTNQSDLYLPYIMDFTAFTMVPVDLDNDGDLDIFVGAGFLTPQCSDMTCGYTETDLVCEIDPPLPLTSNLQDRVLIRGDSLPYVDATSAWNVPPGGDQTVATALDVDEDGKMDVMVGDDFGGSRLLHNVGGTFKAYDTAIGLHPYSGSMGWTVGDFNSDQKPDLVLAESGPAPLYMHQPPQPGLPVVLKDMGDIFGTWAPTWGASAWAPVVGDFDHNGHDDLMLGIAVNFDLEKSANSQALCTASQQMGAQSIFDGQPSHDVLFLNIPGKGMVPQKVASGTYSHVVFVEQAAIDLDNDGDLDLVQTRPGATMMPTSLVRILRNDLPKAGESFKVVLEGKGKNKDALGSRVTANVGGVIRTRWLNGSGAFGGTPARFAHFGLGGAKEAKDVTVIWPDGSKTVLGTAKAGATLQATWP